MQQKKIRFLSKKERQELKQKKQQPHPNFALPTPTHSTNQTQSQQQSVMSPIIEEKDENHQQKEAIQLPKVELTKMEKEERDNIKKNYLGLVKQEKVKRHQTSYKSKLLFEWDKSEDTHGGILGSKTAESVRALNNRKGANMDDLIEVKTWKDKEYEEMTDRDWRIFREDMEIFIKGGRVPNPFRNWKELQDLDPKLIRRLQKLKFQKPKPIQMQSIPIGLNYKDLVAIAPTGEGKTLGYLIPVMQFVKKYERLTPQNSASGPYAIVLVPSRELAEQIVDEFAKIQFAQITALRVVGGVQIDIQAIQIERGCDILVATPGRLKQLIEKHYMVLNRCSWVVIDQADKMISQNLVEDVEWILDAFGSQSLIRYESHGKTRVTHMFSATMVPEIQKLTKKYLVAPVFVTIGQVGGGKKQIQQYVELIDENQKNESLKRILRGLPGPIMIFVSTRAKCDKIVKLIEGRFQRTCADYHGGKNQQARQKIIHDFRTGKFQILVATDLGGRGLDIKGINAVISYDAPKNISEFIHRAGRSGRAGVKGKAFTLLTGEDEQIFYDVRILMERNEFKIPENFREHPASQVKPGTVAQIARRKQIVYTN